MMKFKKWKKLIVMIMVATMFLQSVVVYADDGTNGMPSQTTETPNAQTTANDESSSEEPDATTLGETPTGASDTPTPVVETPTGTSGAITPVETPTEASGATTPSEGLSDKTTDKVNNLDKETEERLLKTELVNEIVELSEEEIADAVNKVAEQLQNLGDRFGAFQEEFFENLTGDEEDPMADFVLSAAGKFGEEFNALLEQYRAIPAEVKESESAGTYAELENALETLAKAMGGDLNDGVNLLIAAGKKTINVYYTYSDGQGVKNRTKSGTIEYTYSNPLNGGSGWMWTLPNYSSMSAYHPSGTTILHYDFAYSGSTYTCTRAGATFNLTGSGCALNLILKCDHSWSWNSNSTQHWQTCSKCGAEQNRASHSHTSTWHDADCYHAGYYSYTNCTCGYSKANTTSGSRLSPDYGGQSWYDVVGTNTQRMDCKRCGGGADGHYKTQEKQTTRYTVTYNANGGNGAPDPSYTNYSADTTKQVTISSTKPSYAGHKFLGWNTSSGSSSAAYQPGVQYNITGDMILYAVWEDNVTHYAEVVYHGMSGTDADDYSVPYSVVGADTISNVKIDGGEKFPAKGIAVFKGWNKNASLARAGSVDPSYAPGKTVSIPATSTDEDSPTQFNLYAVWQKYYLRYVYDGNADGVTNIPNDNSYYATVTGTGTHTISTTVPKRDGYNFKGWNSQADGNGIGYTAGATYNFDTTGDTRETAVVYTFYAQWECAHEKDKDGNCTNPDCDHDDGCCPKPSEIKVPVTIKVRFEGLENAELSCGNSQSDYTNCNGHPKGFFFNGTSSNPQGTTGGYYTVNSHNYGVEAGGTPYTLFDAASGFGAWTVIKGQEYTIHYNLSNYQASTANGLLNKYRYVSANGVENAGSVDIKFKATDTTLQTLVITLKYESVEQKPEKPTTGEINAMSGRLHIVCDDNDNHNLLWDLGYSGEWCDRSADVIKGADGKYHWSMTVNVDKWVALDSDYLKNNRESIDYDHLKSNNTIEPLEVNFTYTDGAWTMDSEPYIHIHGEKQTYIWYDEDGTAKLDEQTVSKCLNGLSASDYKGEQPTKAATADFTYEFKEWDGPTTDQDGNITYKAIYTETPKGKPVLSITKTVDKASVKVGGTLKYTITVKNEGTADATEVEVSDTLPVELDAGILESSPGDYSMSKKGGITTVTWELGTIEPGASNAKTIEFTVKTKTAGKIENSASVECKEVPDPVPTDPENLAKTTIYDLSVTKSNNGFHVNQITGIASVRYTVTVTNNSGFPLHGLDIIDTLTTAEVKNTSNNAVNTVDMELIPVSLSLKSGDSVSDIGTPGQKSDLTANLEDQSRTWNVLDRSQEFRSGDTVTLVYDIEIVNTGTTGVNVALKNRARGGSWTTAESGTGTARKILRRMFMGAARNSDPYDAVDEATSGSSIDMSSAGGHIPAVKSFNLAYDFNGGEDGPEKQRHTTTEDSTTSHAFDVAGIESPVVIPENGNKVFKGWSETKNGAVQYAYDSTAKTYSPDTVSVELEAGKNTASKTLYAVWEDPQQTPRTITVKYWAEGADPKKDEPLKTEIIKTIDNKPIVDGDTYKESELADEEDITGPDGKHYVVETKPSDEEKTVAGDVVIDVICTPDTVVDPDNDSNGNKPGDGIPDKYQKTVTYKVENGTWSDGTEDNIEKVFSLKVKGADGNLVDKTDVTLGDSIPEDMIADTANGYDQDNGGWNEKISSSTAVTDDVTYTYKFEAATHTIKVVYKDEDGNVIATEEFPADGSDPIEYGDKYKETDYVKDEITVDDEHYVVEMKPSDEEKTVTGDVVIEVICTPDTVVDPDNDSNGDEPGDGIPDKYQKTVTYKVLNGTWNNGTKDDIEKVFSLKVKDAAGNLVDNADVTLGDSIPEGMIADTANGYDQNYGAWNEEISSSTPVSEDVTYTYTFEAVETKTMLTIKVKGTSTTEVYDGSEKTVSGYTLTVKDKDGNEITLPDGLSVTPDTDSCEAKGTEAGTYQMGLSKDNFSLTGTDADKYDVTFEVEDGILIITKGNTLTVGAGDVEATYDGEEHPVTPVVNDPDATVKIEYQRVDEDGNPVGDPIDGNPKDAGTYIATITATLPDGTEVTNDAKVTISKRGLTVTTGSGSKTFDNTPLTNSTATVTVAGGAVKNEVITATATGSQTAVGSSANGYEIDWDTLGINPDNYEITEVLGTLTVNAATPNTPDPTPPTPPTGGGGTGGGGGGTPDPTPTPAPTPGPAPVVPVPAAGTPVVPAAPAPAAAQTVTPVAATPAPAAPAAEGPAIEALEDEEVPLAAGEGEEEAPELAALDDEEVPLAPGKGGSWALINFALMNLAIFESLMLLIGYFAKTKNDDEERKLKKKGIFRILSIPVAVISLIAFILTEDITLPTAFVDKYTIIMLIIAIVQTVVVALSNKKYEDEEEA